MGKVNGLVLVSAASEEQQAIAGVPGLWSTNPDLAVIPEVLGVDEEEIVAALKAAGIKYASVEVEAPPAETDGETAKEITASIGDRTGYELLALLDDDRKTVREAAAEEIARRDEAGENV